MLKLKELNFQLVIGITAFLNLRTIVNSERVCTVLAGIDEPLFNHYDKNISYLTDLIETHFDRVNIRSSGLNSPPRLLYQVQGFLPIG